MDECEFAHQLYTVAMSLARKHHLADVVAMLEWKLFKADSCLGSAVLPLPGPEEEDPKCGIAALGNEELLADFEVAASRNGFRRVKQWPAWFDLFGLTEQSCSPKTLKASYRKLMVQYHPDKFDGPHHCALTMSLLVNAGKELLENRGACVAGGSEREL